MGRKKMPGRKPRTYRAKTVAGTVLRSKYSDAERVAALCVLDGNGGNVHKTALEMEIPVQTLLGWAKKKHRSYLHLLKNGMKGNMANAFEEVAWLCLGQSAGRVESAPLNQLMVSAGIAVDKMRLLREQPTAIGSNTNTNVKIDLTKLSPEERAQLADLLRKTRDEPGNSAHVGTESRGDADRLGPRVVPGIPDRVVPDAGTEPGR